MRVSSRLLRCFCQSKFWAIIRVDLYSPVSRSLQCYRNEFFCVFSHLDSSGLVALVGGVEFLSGRMGCTLCNLLFSCSGRFRRGLTDIFLYLKARTKTPHSTNPPSNIHRQPSYALIRLFNPNHRIPQFNPLHQQQHPLL